jgi:hypothetical protein
VLAGMNEIRTIAIYFQNHMKHINIIWKKIADLKVTAGDILSYHSILSDLID